MKWVRCGLALIIAFTFFLAAATWYGKASNVGIALMLLAGSIWSYNAMESRHE